MDILLLVSAFCGGIFGAALGSLTAFIFTGITGLIGITFMAAGVQGEFMFLIPFGIFFGPHIAFAGGAAAAAYARKRGYIESGKDIVKPLMSLRKPDVLIVGGVCGAFGYIVNHFVALAMPGMIDTVALSVVIIALVTKVLFGNIGLKEIIGVVPNEIKKVGGRFSPNSSGMWVEYMNLGYEKIVIAIGAGGVSGYVTYVMLQSEATAGIAAFVGFVISASSLLFLQQGLPIPVTHHITLGASYAVLMTNSIAWGFAGAIMGAFLGDYLAKTFHVYGDAHVDPPALSIASNSFLLFAVFPMLNIYSMGDVVAYAIIGFFAIVSVVEYASMSKVNAESKSV